ncbi:MAG: M20 family metallopeptidase [Armatimonadota bacterium]
MDLRTLEGLLQSRRDAVAEGLCELIRFRSTVGSEGPLARHLEALLSAVADEVELIPVPESVKDDPDYSDPVRGLTYEARPNVRVQKRGIGGGRSLIINTHMDVVPPADEAGDQFEPRRENGRIYGRGACDAKGQIATIHLALTALKELDVRLHGDLEVHLVIEEEVGGNGTVAMARLKPHADAASVMEPTDFAILPQVRGAVWFEATVRGQSGHSGRPGGTISALTKALEAIQIFQRYHDRALAESRGKYPLFDEHADPAPLLIGQLEAGDWPSKAPQRAVFKGVLGILPDRTKEQVMQDLRMALRTEGEAWLAQNTQVKFTYRHDANVIAPDHPLVRTLARACVEAGRETKVAAMTASCDAWMYNNQLGIPTVVFGPGNLSVAHSAHEHIETADVIKGAEVLVMFIRAWCGAAA